MQSSYCHDESMNFSQDGYHIHKIDHDRMRGRLENAPQPREILIQSYGFDSCDMSQSRILGRWIRTMPMVTESKELCPSPTAYSYVLLKINKLACSWQRESTKVKTIPSITIRKCPSPSSYNNIARPAISYLGFFVCTLVSSYATVDMAVDV